MGALAAGGRLLCTTTYARYIYARAHDTNERTNERGGIDFALRASHKLFICSSVFLPGKLYGKKKSALWYVHEECTTHTNVLVLQHQIC